jgi:hypothetical protein
VSRGRKKAKEIDPALITRARLVADYLLTLNPPTDEETIKERRRRTSRNAEEYLEDIGTPKFDANIQRAAYFASTGARHWCELCLVIAAYFVERGEPVPAPLRTLVASTLRETLMPKSEAEKKRNELYEKRFPRIVGRPNGNRNRSIASAVLHVAIDTGLKPTRNRAQRTKGAPQSACSIVHEALGWRKVNLSEDAVEQIWRASRTDIEKERQWMVEHGVVIPLVLREFY